MSFDCACKKEIGILEAIYRANTKSMSKLRFGSIFFSFQNLAS